MTPDHINAAFETVFAVLVWLNLRRLLIDKRVEGVSLWVQGFGCLYGLWALVLYWSLGMWWSLSGQVVMSLGSISWLTAAVYLKYSTLRK